jgi:magnesium-protoporphyrin IX monomethyl ester (oxidative) cyclase
LPELFDARFERDLIGSVARSRPDLIAVSVKTTMYSGESYMAARRLREAVPGAKIVLGGLHATSCPEEALGHGDFVVRGEGERTFRQLVAGVNPAAIPGLARHGPDGPMINPLEDPVANLDELAPPARHLRKPHYRYAAAGLIPMDLLETSRGCTHACTFCSPASVYPHCYRTHSPGYVMEEILRLEGLGVKYCMVTDDHFGGDLARVEALCDRILESGVRIAFFTFIRPFAGQLEIKRKMVAAGFVMLSYGAESPSKEQLKRYGKGYPEGGDFIRQVNSEWLRAGARYVGNSYVFGDVEDSARTIDALGAYARRLDPTYIEPLYSQPFPGTPYRAELAAAGKLLPHDWSMFTESRLLVRHPELDEERLRHKRARMWVHFFSPRKAVGAFRVPLYLHQHVGVGVFAVLRYMKACDYSVFGCVLEDKFYRDLQLEMVRDYFHHALPTFEPEELDITENFDDFTEMVGLGPLKRFLGTADLVLRVVENDRTLASAALSIEGGHVVNGRVVVGERPVREGIRTLHLPVSLSLLARFLGSTHEAAKLAALLAIVFNLVLFDLPRKLVCRLESARRGLASALWSGAGKPRSDR